VAAVIHAEPPPIAEKIPSPLVNVIGRCLEKRPEERFQAARDLAIRLREILREAEDEASLWRKRVRQGVAWSAAAGLATLLVFGGMAISRTRRPVPTPIDTFAVLPLTNTSKDPAVDYLIDGITENLINETSELLPSVRVTARPTVFHYKGQTIDPVRIGRELGVRVFATGRIDVRDDQMVVQADLIDAANGAQLWGAQYTRSRSDVRMVASEIAHEIASRLGAEPPPRQPIARTATDSPIAYDLYLKGLHALRRETPDDRSQAISYFQEAIEIDHKFARAHAALAEAYVRASNQHDPAVMRAKARDSIKRALALDPDLAEAHVSLGTLHLFEWNLRDAEVALKLALRKNASLASAHTTYSHLLRYAGRFDEALEHAVKAKDLDPLSRGSHIALANTYFYAGQYQKATGELRHLLTIAPNFATGHYLLARVYEQEGRAADACAEYVRFQELSEQDSRSIEAVRQSCRGAAATGLKAFYREQLRVHSSETVPGTAYVMAALHTALGEDEEAYRYLERAFEEKSQALLLLNTDPAFERIRAQPRFQRLLEKIGFARTPPIGVAASTGAADRRSSN
jgi:TolB-like protein/Flp pilus assembly protein TadD